MFVLNKKFSYDFRSGLNLIVFFLIYKILLKLLGLIHIVRTINHTPNLHTHSQRESQPNF